MTPAEHTLLTLVSALVVELDRQGPVPGLDDPLEDLGISSLERLELLLRIEKTCGVRLPDSVMAEAGTTRTLAAAIAATTPGGFGVSSAGSQPFSRDRPADARQPPDTLGDATLASVPAATSRAGRLARNAFRLVFTVWVLAACVSTLPVLWILLLVLPGSRHAERAVKGWSRLVLALCGMAPHVAGADNLTGIGPAILVVNHASYIDSVVMMAAIRPHFRFVAKHRLGTLPLIGTVIRKVGHATIEKNDMAQRIAGGQELARLACEDGLLVLFPEGTFAREPGLLPFRLGAFKAAVDAGRPVLPVAIKGTRRALPADAWLFHHGRIDVVIGAPIVPRGSDWQEIVRLRNLAREHIARETGEGVQQQ
jgi:1-acyl-sn-glycerol-3-phosphate acyltransferase